MDMQWSVNGLVATVLDFTILNVPEIRLVCINYLNNGQGSVVWRVGIFSAIVISSPASNTEFHHLVFLKERNITSPSRLYLISHQQTTGREYPEMVISTHSIITDEPGTP